MHMRKLSEARLKKKCQKRLVEVVRRAQTGLIVVCTIQTGKPGNSQGIARILRSILPQECKE